MPATPPLPAAPRATAPLILALLLVLGTTLATAVAPPGALPSDSPTPLAVPVDAIAACPPTRQARELADELETLRHVRDTTRAEREALCQLGRQMDAVLSQSQATWIAAHRTDVSLNQFEKPYWSRLEALLRP